MSDAATRGARGSATPPRGTGGPGGSAGPDTEAVDLLVAGRYQLLERTGSGGAATIWRARDAQLQRQVVLRAVVGDVAEEVVDAARRVTAVEDPRLPRVLDAGTGTDEQGRPSAWIVTEKPPGRWLLDVLDDGPLPAPAARQLVGEAARALARASALGLHHRRLDPSLVHLSEGGAVTVSGLELEAAAAGLPPVDPAAAEREDAVALVAVLYAALTGTWPRTDGTGGAEQVGLPAAPHPGGQPLPPGDLVADVPADLDTLCAVTFGPYDDGPTSPRELADQLAPWEPVAGQRGRVRRREGATGARPAVPPAGDALAGTREQPAVGDWAPTRATGLPGTTGGVPLPTSSPLSGPVATTPPPAPGPARARSQGGARGRGPWIAVLLVALVAIGLWAVTLAGGSLGGLLGGGGDGDQAAAPTTTAPAPAAEPFAISGVASLDPLGDDEENDDQLPRSFDGDPATAWNSSTYENAAFGNLKEGMGLEVSLTGVQTVTTVELAIAGTGGQVEVRSAEGDPTTAQVLGSAAVGSGDGAPVTVTLSEPVETDRVVLWFTTLPEDEGEYVVRLAQVDVR